MGTVDNPNKDIGNAEVSTGSGIGSSGLSKISVGGGGPSGSGVLYNDGSSYVLLNDGSSFLLLNG